MATPAQIAARKKFAERARSGELAKMRKKATRKSNPTGVTDYAPKSQGGTRKQLLEIFAKTKDPKDAEKARKAGATQKELQEALRARKSNPTPTKVRAVKSNPRNRDSLTEEYRKMDFETFKDYYLENEDKNMHTENVVILARRYGNAKMVREAETIAKIHDRVGYLPDDVALARRKLETILLPKYGIEMSDLIRKTVKSNPTATRATRSRTKSISNGREKNPVTKDVFFANVLDDGGFQFGMDSRTPVTFKFSNREMKRGVYRSFALPYIVTTNPMFQAFVRTLPQATIIVSLNELKEMLRQYI